MKGSKMPDYRRQLRVGLQLKSILILALIVIAITASGGWFYFHNVRSVLHDADLHYAQKLAEALEFAAGDDLNDSSRLEKLCGEFIINDRVLYVSLLDGQGR